MLAQPETSGPSKSRAPAAPVSAWPLSLCPRQEHEHPLALSLQDINAYNGEQPAEQLPFPIIADKNRELALKLGMLDPDELDKDGMPLTARVVSARPTVPVPAEQHRNTACQPALCLGDSWAAWAWPSWGAGMTSLGWSRGLCHRERQRSAGLLETQTEFLSVFDLLGFPSPLNKGTGSKTSWHWTQELPEQKHIPWASVVL